MPSADVMTSAEIGPGTGEGCNGAATETYNVGADLLAGDLVVDDHDDGLEERVQWRTVRSERRM